MSTATVRKENPLSLRMGAADIAVIDRAAALRGRSRTEFMRDAAVRAAEETLLEALPIRMSAEGFDAFMAALAGPGEPVPALVQVLERKAPWERGA